MDITPALRRLVDRKLSRLERVLNDSALSAQIVLTGEKRGKRSDVTLHARGEKFLHGNGLSTTWEVSMTQAIDKIGQQAQKVKGKWQEWRRRGVKGAPVPGQTPPVGRVQPRGARVRPRMPRILLALRQTLKPMSVADAAREVEANGEGIVVFRDVETAAVSVLYRRSSGELMLVETES